jgi:hypothetical protein
MPALPAVMVGTASSAGVLNEATLKQERLGTIHWQNAQLYAFGTCFLLLKLVLQDGQFRPRGGGPQAGAAAPLLAGFNAFSWLCVASSSAFGLATSAAYKYTDSIVRTFGSVFSVLLAAALSWVLGSAISHLLLLGTAITSGALLLYLSEAHGKPHGSRGGGGRAGARMSGGLCVAGAGRLSFPRRGVTQSGGGGIRRCFGASLFLSAHHLLLTVLLLV